ncbi:ABC transporter substrate-binding protein [Photobacterium alginatilyticum]|nr:ABC transporter substrate-binding protein [Photobacterium alginatilyticum]
MKNLKQSNTQARFTPLSRRQIIHTASVLGAAGTLSMYAPGVLGARDAADTPQDSNLPLKLGVCGPFSGPAKQTGDAIRQGVLMALEDAGAAGEAPVTINGVRHDVEVIWVDSQSNPEIAAKATTEAIQQQGVKLMVGGWHSSVALALMDITADLNTIHLGHLGASQYIAAKINDDPQRYRGWFKGWPSPPKLAGLYGAPLKYLLEHELWLPANRRAAILVEDSAFGRGWGEALMRSLKEAGFDPLPFDTAALDETEFRQLLNKYKSEQVSLVAMTSTGDVAASSFVKQFKELGVKALLLGHGLRWLGNWYEMTGDAANFVVSMDSAMPIALWQRWWVRRFKTKYGKEPTIPAAGFHYDYTRMAIKALNTANSLDFDTLTAIIRQIPYKGVWNYYQFSSAPGPNALSANEVMTGPFMKGFYLPMVQLFDGQAKIIWPIKYAEQRFRQPPWI